MDYSDFLEELDTLTTCQEALAELLGAASEGLYSTRKLAVLLDYLQSQQGKLLETIKR
tara:strand:- start:606 stop:779 length:174 start_codon:yes stop_codon:yes gene_type:complete